MNVRIHLFREMIMMWLVGLAWLIRFCVTDVSAVTRVPDFSDWPTLDSGLP